MWEIDCLPAGKFNVAMENGLVVVDIPIKSGDVPWLCGCLPEGKSP